MDSVVACFKSRSVRTATFLLLLAAICGGLHADEPAPGWFEGMFHPPKVVVALPKNFIVTSASKDAKKSKEFNMYDGNIWAPQKTARQFEFLAETSFLKAKEPMFWVHLSEEVAQNPGTDDFTNEPNIVANWTSAFGFKKVKSAKTKWATYPVLSLTGERPDGSPFFVAWIGINSPDGWAIIVDYRVPKGEGHPTKEEREIWETFLKETKPQK